MVSLGRVVSATDQESDRVHWHLGQPDEALLRKLVEDHHKWTGSLRARDILDHWSESLARFVKVMPNEYRRALGQQHAPAAPAAAVPEDRAGATSPRSAPQRNIVPAK
jgi:glutamate synthase domain-containing protein 3